MVCSSTNNATEQSKGAGTCKEPSATKDVAEAAEQREGDGAQKGPGEGDPGYVGRRANEFIQDHERGHGHHVGGKGASACECGSSIGADEVDFAIGKSGGCVDNVNRSVCLVLWCLSVTSRRTSRMN